MEKRRFPTLGIALLITVGLTLSCKAVSGPIPGASSEGPAAPITTSNEDDLTQIDLWTQATTTLHSMALELTDEYGQGGGKTLSAQVDGSGNMHLRMPMLPPPEGLADPAAEPSGDFELFVVNGAAYTRIGQEAEVVRNDSYLTFLADTLAGPEGPGIWLNLVSEEGYSNEGSEEFSGFSTTKYAVDGEVGEGRISGTIWVDSDSSALVGADLTVAENVFFPPDADARGDVHIRLTVQASDIPEITLP